MGRKKSRPVRSGGIFSEVDVQKSGSSEHKLESCNHLEGVNESNNQESLVLKKPFYVGIDCSHWKSDEHLDIAEVILNDVQFTDEAIDEGLVKDGKVDPNFCLRFQLHGVEEGSFKLGHWPVLSTDCILLECIVLDISSSERSSEPRVLSCGVFDGPDESVSGLVHLVNQKFLTLRLVSQAGNLFDAFRVRVELLRGAFDSCQSLLDSTRQPWRKSMLNVMSWLRPEVTTSEAIYGTNLTAEEQANLHAQNEISGKVSEKDSGFDVAAFYEAIKPSKEEPMMEDELPDLLPELRPYQRRAAYWMLQREKMAMKTSGENIQNELLTPFCLPVVFLDKYSKMFYNPFNGGVSLHPESSKSLISGGILADEMGLGKTVELLACILAHRKPSSEDGIISSENGSQDLWRQMKRQKRERVECVCGAAAESSKYQGLWVQCDVCDAWQHADCVGYSPKKKHSMCPEVDRRKGNKTSPISSKNQKNKKGITNIIEMEGNYICGLCAELIDAASSNISTGATLIVCPGPILAQWHSEIIRHTRTGSVKISIYDGAKNIRSPAALRTQTSELATADVVLTTYDVLKEDLSHDSDRHDGDRHFMRFQKRYPVVPTILTRIYWWRLCLDEAQMVESNTSSVTEMAMRLRAQHRWCITGTPIQRRLDDMYGLLRFLRASPFDVYRWWVEAIRDPYERRDTEAMKFVHRIFKQIMWRSSKMHVAEELQLPPQDECLSWLTFSPIEEHFYQKQHETCMGYAHEIIKSFKGDNSRRKYESDSHGFSDDGFLSRDDVAKLLFPLLKLRQACCHPQVGSSGLCSLQNTPLTMEEILEMLINKTKIEGEEALRRIVVALNGLAAIAIIEEDNNQALSLYRESLAIADENADDFRLDPLLSLHVHHNLAELLPVISEDSRQCSHVRVPTSRNGKGMKRNISSFGIFDRYYVKRQKASEGNKPVVTAGDTSVDDNDKQHNHTEHISACSDDDILNANHDSSFRSSRCFADKCLKKICENIKQKYLSVFTTKLSAAQKDFRNSHLQVLNLYEECKNQTTVWWLHALNLVEQSKDSSEDLLLKIDQAISRAFNSSKTIKYSSRFRNISGLKYTIQTGLDSLEGSRQTLLERLIEIDQEMENPKDDDIERVRYCPNCNDGNGSLCVHCELDEVFQAYEARLFLIKKGNNGALVTSVEEVLDLQKQKIELNRFFRESKTSMQFNTADEKSKQRQVKANVQVSRNPSELEITLGIIKSYCKMKLGRQGIAAARKHLLLFEAMRKEFSEARCLSVAQAHILRAHDEIKWATSRLRLKESDDEPAAVNVLSREELIPSSMQFSSDKFLVLSSLGRIRGQLRYLKGLAQSKQKAAGNSNSLLSSSEDQANLASCPDREEGDQVAKTAEDEPCPICQENFSHQKMVFQCGHVICCKCCLKMTEQAAVRFGKCQQKWVVCPTCRQQTDIENIAFVQEKRNRGFGLTMIPNALETHAVPDENSITVQGSYGTKIEAVTRRILWIKAARQEAKVIVFSSWNDVLDVLEHALDTNNITHVRMKGGRKSQAALSRFKGRKGNGEENGKVGEQPSKTESIQVLLMLIQHGANGLNILEAEHVILVEPLLNPAAEAQAISRVHRIGQEKTTFVHRFIVKNTVEESIYKLNKSRHVSSIIGIRSKHQDQPALTLKDVESLFPTTIQTDVSEEQTVPTGSLSHLPPAVAAGLAAERRLMENSNNQTRTIAGINDLGDEA